MKGNTIIVSRCTKIQGPVFYFHFQGFHSGKEIKEVRLVGDEHIKIKEGIEYLLYVTIQSFEDAVIFGKIIKAKTLEALWDKA